MRFVDLSAIAVLAAVTLFGDASAAAPTKPAKRGLQTAFDPSVERLPPKFAGHDAHEVIQALRQRPAPEKSEFELTADYERRLAKWRQEKLLGSVGRNDVLAIGYDVGLASMVHATRVAVTFDADASTVTAYVDSPKCHDEDGVVLTASKKKVGSYVGHNAFGVKAKVTQTVTDIECLRYERLYINESWKIDADAAKKLKQSGRFLFIGKLDHPPLAQERSAESATINDPEDNLTRYDILKLVLDELWIYDPGTGEVYMKHRVRTTPAQ